MMRMLEQMVSSLAVTPTCPRCKGIIPSNDINVAQDIAFCRNCNLSHQLSALTLGTTVDENVDVSSPPDGTWFHEDGRGAVVGATHRSPGQALALLLVCLFWNGIVSIFVLLAMASTLQHLGVPVPHWFPAPTSDGKIIPAGMTIFLWLFLTPFIAIGLAMVAAFLSCLGGRTEIRIDRGEVTIFTGLGAIGLRKSFSALAAKDVRIEDKRWRDSDGDSRRRAQVVIETDSKPIRFGSMLTDERRRFIASALKKKLVQPW